MNPETYTTRPELTRKQKLARRFVPLALLASGAAVYGAAETAGHDDRHENLAEATTTAHATVELGGADSGWGHTAAEKAIQRAVAEGLTHVAVETPDTPADKLDIDAVIADLPVYAQADKALEMAGYDTALPDKGDVLSVDVEVTLDADHAVSYEVTDAHITDLPNNQTS